MDNDHDRAGFYVLKRTYSSLYKKTSYLCKLPIIQNRITEYDIRSANTTMLRRSRMVKSSTLDEIEALPGHERKVIIGKMELRDPRLKKTIARGILQAKRELFEANSIQDNEILSIKNDAVFIIGRKLRTTQFGPVEFRPKNVYALYLNIEKIEFYYDSKNDIIAVKGVKDEVVEHPDHQEGMVKFFATVMKYLVYDRKDALRRYLIEFSSAYKEKKLPVVYYREFNGQNVYRTDMELAGHSFNMIEAGENDKDIINGVYNYKRYILPLIQVYI